MTLYNNSRNFTEPILTVHFDSQGGSAIADKKFNASATNAYHVRYNVSAPVNPTKANKVFAGWYKDAECTQVFTFGNA